MDATERAIASIVALAVVCCTVVAFRGCSSCEADSRNLTDCTVQTFEECAAARNSDCGSQAALACRGEIGRP